MLVNSNPFASVIDANKNNGFIFLFLAAKMKPGESEKLYLMDILKNVPCDIAFPLPVFFGSELA